MWAGASRFASPLPAVDAFWRFIEAAQRRRAAGDTRGSAAVPHNAEPAVGWFQFRSLEPRFKTAELGAERREPFAANIDRGWTSATSTSIFPPA
jgi:hypothetical protein